jgi:membrane fusion protein (multidrug efflux system)
VTSRQRALALGALLLGGGLLVLRGCRGGEQKVAAELPGVVVATAVALDVPIELDASGELQARDETSVAAEVAGRVTRILVDEGGAVAGNGVVLEIDPERRRLELDSAAAQLAQAQASLEKDRRQTERVRELFQKNVSSKAALDDAETALRLSTAHADAERAERGVAQRALDDASVHAPFAGLVSHRHVNVGEFVQVGTKLFDMVSLDPVEVVFHLPEVDSSRVQLGQPVDVTLSPFPGEVFRGQVSVISPIIDTATRTLRVKAVIPNADGKLRPGLFARASLGVELRRGLVMVPDDALLERSDGKVLFVVGEGNRVRRVVVEVGVAHEGLVEVRSGIAPGDLVVRRGHDKLVGGEVVALRDAEGGPVATDVADGVKKDAGL